MADENQEMEDILSSIKSILEEDEKQQKDNDLTVKADVVDEALNSDIGDDIFELSQDMKIADPEDSNFTTATVAENNINDTSFSESEPFFETSVEETTISEPVVEEDVSSQVEDIAETEPVVDEEVSSPVEVIAEPEPVVEEEVSSSVEVIAEPEPVVEEEVSSPNEGIAEPEPVVEEEVSAPVEVIAEPEPVVEEEVSSSVEVIASPEPVVEEVSEIEDQDSADVSTGIISNFAKLFSHNDEAPSPEVSDSSNVKITSVGDTSKTMEQFILESIIKVIGSEIKEKWNDGADFQSFAKAEIENQTKEWIEKNIQTVIEEKIKQEIERVIAKVNS